MNRAIKYRAYPTTAQEAQFAKTFGCCRKVWNLMLADKIDYYKACRKSLYTTPAQYKDAYPYLREVDSLALANVQLNLQAAYKNFFENRKSGFPKFKVFPSAANAVISVCMFLYCYAGSPSSFCLYRIKHLSLCALSRASNIT